MAVGMVNQFHLALLANISVTHRDQLARHMNAHRRISNVTSTMHQTQAVAFCKISCFVPRWVFRHVCSFEINVNLGFLFAIILQASGSRSETIRKYVFFILGLGNHTAQSTITMHNTTMFVSIPESAVFL